MQFNSLTESALRRAGWIPGRKVETWRYEADYSQAHLEFPEFARSFLIEFGHLILQPDPKPCDMECDVWFNTVYAAGFFDGDLLNRFKEAVGHSIVPIGEFNLYDENWYRFSYNALMLGDQGSFYSSIIDLDNLILVANNMDELYEYQLGIRPGVFILGTEPHTR